MSVSFKKNKIFLLNSLMFDSNEQFIENCFNYSSTINQINENGETLLHYACFYGLIEKFYSLINFGATPLITKNKNTLLHYACYSGNDPFIIVELIKLGISPLSKNVNGESPIHLVSDEKIANYLYFWCLRNKIKLSELLDLNENTVLHASKKYQHQKTLEYFLKQEPTLSTIKNKNGHLYLEQQTSNQEFCQEGL